MAKDLITTVTTKNDFKQAFNSAHLNASDTAIVHTSLSKFYYVPGEHKPCCYINNHSLFVHHLCIIFTQSSKNMIYHLNSLPTGSPQSISLD